MTILVEHLPLNLEQAKSQNILLHARLAHVQCIGTCHVAS